MPALAITWKVYVPFGVRLVEDREDGFEDEAHPPIPTNANSRRQDSRVNQERLRTTGNKNKLARQPAASIFIGWRRAAVCVWEVVTVSVVLPPLAIDRLAGEKLHAAYSGRSAHVKVIVPVAPGRGCCTSV